MFTDPITEKAVYMFICGSFQDLVTLYLWKSDHKLTISAKLQTLVLMQNSKINSIDYGTSIHRLYTTTKSRKRPDNKLHNLLHGFKSEHLYFCLPLILT